ncbi:MAG: Gldg family protein, partial [Proteobacteria bacterium]|nr:Gldg family protein [Pseudomonadota bacterium]
MQMFAKLDRSRLAFIGAVLAVVAFLAFNIFTNAAFKGVRLDLTDEGLFTLSDGTRKILAGIDEPISIRLYVTKRLTELNPAHATYAARIRELL